MKRLTPATMTMVMFSILGLLVVGYVAKTALTSQEKKVVVATRDIPMAITDISPGTVITDRHLGMGKMNVDRLTREMLLTNRVIVGRVVKTPLKAAEPIMANQLYQPGELPKLELGAGMRAVTVQMTDGASMVDGIIKPGDYVDVLFTAASGGRDLDSAFEGGVILRLFEGVKILAINRSFTQASVDRGNNYVTLELTETQSNVIVLARDKGKLTMIYNPNGKGNGGIALSNAERITLYEILGLVPATKPAPPVMTEIYRGAGRMRHYFDDRGLLIDSRASPTQTNNDRQFVLPPTQGPAPAAGPTADPAARGPTAPDSSPPRPAVPQDNQDPPRPGPTASLPRRQPN